MTEQVESFLYGVFGEDSEGLLATGLVGEGKGRPINRQRFWEWPAQAAELIEWVDQHSNEDVYFSPMLFGEQRRTKDAVIHTPVLWADTDDADPMSFEVTPSIVVETSPKRWQAYWCLDADVSPVWAEQMSKKITYAHKAEGSDYGWARGKFLRIPGTTNCKPMRGYAKVTVKFLGEVYSPDTFIETYGHADIEPDMLLANRKMPALETLPSKADVLARLQSNPMIDRALNSQDRIRGWSETLWWVECELFRVGLTAEEVFVLAHGSANDKYQRDGRPPADLWKEILRAEQATVLDRIAYNGPDKEAEPMVAREPKPELLTDAERKMLPRTFIDDYVEWAATRTNGDPGYHEFGAMSCLSTVLADFGHAVPSFGELKLNLWFMILGVTTRTYKTTAKKLMLEILGKIQTEDYQYDMGSDTTPEGLMLELSDHPGRSVLFHRDEANAMIQDAKGGKSYMTGFGEALTELYDGFVRGRLRATGTKRKVASVETAFNLFLLGVPEKLASALTREDFQSGFLARFMYVIGRPEPYEQSSRQLQQMSTHDKAVDDKARTELRNQVLSMRSYWSKVTEPGNTIPVRCNDAAWLRFNKALGDLDDVAYASDMRELMEPCANRMNKMILKLATLLAMADRKREVELPYMLAAIAYCEDWYQSLSTVVRMVGRSEFGAQVDQVVAMVAGGPKHYTQVRREFKNVTQRQWTEILNAAVDQSLIEIKESGRAKVIAAV